MASIPAAPEARVEAARLTGLALADLNRRLAGILPRIILPGVPEDQAPTLVAGLEALGFAALSFAPAMVPGDADRIVAHKVHLGRDEIVFEDAQGNRHVCRAGSLSLLQRGSRSEKTSTTTTSSSRKLDVGRAILSGGVLLTRKVETKTVRTTETEEAFLLVARGQGAAAGDDVIIHERRLDYRFLGAEMQPSSRANLELLWGKLRALAPQAATDERVARPGFVRSLPLTAADPVDLALYLVALARLKEGTGPHSAPR